MSPPLTIALLGNDPADRQWSMLDYGTSLQRALTARLGASARVTLQAPDTTESGRWLRRGRIGRASAMYWSRYVVYPRVVQRCRADVYHILDHGNGWLIRWLDPARTVVFCHDLIPLVLRARRESLWPWVSEGVFRQAVRAMTSAAAVLVNSACTRRDLTETLGYPAARVHVVPLGVDPMMRPAADEAARAAARAAFRLPAGRILLHVGQTAWYKNVEGVLATVHQLTRRREPVWLVRAGARLRAGQRRLARRLGVADRVIEMGELPREALRQFYHAADLFLYPSWYEGQGLPPLEAMASGVPVIVSDRGALPETVGAAGLVVPPEPSQWADAVQQLLGDSERYATFRTLGVVRAGEFRWETAAQRTLDVYRTILACYTPSGCSGGFGDDRMAGTDRAGDGRGVVHRLPSGGRAGGARRARARRRGSEQRPPRQPPSPPRRRSNRMA